MRQRAPYLFTIAFCAATLAFGVTAASPIQGLAPVGWTPSTSLLIGEVVTGGSSGSDEFVEVYNAAAQPLDLGGLELVYVTSSGSTVTRKATWALGAQLPSGAHLLVANSSGIHASVADSLYSGGFAATGGALVLRPIGGAPLDAVGWGDATNAFVEGTAAPAPPPGHSIERRPGALDGNGQDTNDNAGDFLENATPAAQNLAAPPVPAPQPTETAPPDPTTSPDSSPEATPEPTETPDPNETPTPLETPTPTVPPDEVPTPSPSASASPAPSASTVPTPGQEPTSSPGSSASPEPLLTIAEARTTPNGQSVDVIGTLTTEPGLIEAGTGTFLQDGTGGIALYLASATWPAIAQGELVHVHGTVEDRYAQRTIRLASGTDVSPMGSGSIPAPEEIATGVASEAWEGTLVAVTAEITTSADALSDGFAVWADDGSGPLRVLATAVTGIAPADLPLHARVHLSGPLGQRDSSGTGTEGYRLYLRSIADVMLVAQPSPTPEPTSSPSPSPVSTPAPTLTPPSTPSPTPSTTPSPSPAPTTSPPPVLAIAAARSLSIGSRTTVEGVATAETGRILDERSAVLQDASAGIVVRLPRDGWPAFARGARLRVSGSLAEPYGNLELRPADFSDVVVLGPGSLPSPRLTVAREVGEMTEGRLVRATGVVVSVDAPSASGNFGVDVEDASGRLRVYVYATTGIGPEAFPKGASIEVIGIAGQRAARTGSASGQRIWPRDTADVRPGSLPSAGPGATAFPSPSGSPAATSASQPPGPATASIAAAIQRGGSLRIAGTVTTPAGFVDADGRRVAVEDGTGALLVRLPTGVSAPAVGTRIVAVGQMGTYYGSAQLQLSEAPSIVGSASLLPRKLNREPSADLAWRLVRVSGQVSTVHRLGTTWRAELQVAGRSVPIYGGARSGIPSTALIEGRSAAIVGIVRPPYPTATDRRYAIAPRASGDVSLGPGDRAAAPSAPEGSNLPPGTGGYGPGSVGPPGTPIDLELAELAEHQAALVRIGGLVVSATPTRVVIDDGTATAAILLPEDIVASAPEFRPGDALNATGLVVRDGTAWAVAPRSASDVSRVGRLGELAPLLVPTSSPDPVGPVASAAGLDPHWPAVAVPTALALAGTGLAILVRRRSVGKVGRRLLTASRRWGATVMGRARSRA